MPHTFTNLSIHALFSTDGRRPSLDKDMRDELFAYMGGILKRLNCQPLGVSGVSDHIHMLFMLHPSVSLSDAMEKVKANSSKWVHGRWPERRNFAWQRGYTAFSVSPSNLQKVKDYIARQEEHHRRRTYHEEVIALLEKHGVSFDPRDISHAE
jgi:putative transposase